MVKRIACSLLVALILLPAVVFAQSVQFDLAEVNSRLQKAVSDNGVVLEETAKTTLVAKCATAQLYLKEIQNDTPSQIQLRTNTYSEIQKELQAIKIRMKRQGADASETDLLTGKLQQALDKFNAQAVIYQQSLDDLIKVNCQENPEYFQAGLIVMRAQRAKLLDYSLNLQSIMDNSKVNIFDQLKKRLKI
jgi:hypothetical protein